MTILEFEKIYKISMASLKLNRSHPDVPKDWRWVCQAGFMYATYTMTAVSLAYSLFAVDVKKGVLTDTCKDGVFIVLWFEITTKYLVTLFYKDHLTTLMRKTQDYFDEAESMPAEDQVVVTNYAHRGRWLTKLWFFWSCINCFLFPIKAIGLTLYSAYIGQFKVVHWYDYSYPSPINEHKYNPFVFLVIFGYHMCYGVYTITMYNGFGPLGSMFTLNACAQLELLAKEIGTIFVDTPYNYENVSRKVAVVVKKLRGIYRYVELINDMFKIDHEMNLKFSAIMIPVSLYASVETFKRGELAFDYAAFMGTAFLLCYFPCYYSDLLMDKGEAVRYALYASGWERHPDRRARSSLLIMLTVAMRPISIRTVFRSVCLVAFSELCNQSYALFNMMKVAWG